MKKILILTNILFLSSVVIADKLPIKNQDVSPAQLQKQNKEIVQLVAKEESKTLPQKIDKYTTAISVKAKDTSLIYTFEINTGAKSDQAIIKEDHSRMEKAIIKGVCKRSRRFMNAKISKIYIYKSAISKKELFKFTINQAKCIDAYGIKYNLK